MCVFKKSAIVSCITFFSRRALLLLLNNCHPLLSSSLTQTSPPSTAPILPSNLADVVPKTPTRMPFAPFGTSFMAPSHIQSPDDPLDTKSRTLSLSHACCPRSKHRGGGRGPILVEIEGLLYPFRNLHLISTQLG